MALFLGFTGCAKLEEKEQIKSITNPLLKAYFGSFNEGSTWIYEDSASNVENVDVKLYKDQEPNLSILLNSSENNVIQLTTSFDESTITYYKSPLQAVITHRVSAIDSAIKVTQDPSAIRVRVDLLPTYTVKGVVYNDVIHTTDYNDPYYRELYFAKNVGIIEKLTVNNKRFSLKTFNAAFN